MTVTSSVYGMADKEIGPVVFAEKSRGFAGIDFSEIEYSPETARLIDQNVKKLVVDAEKECENILRKNEGLLKRIATDLLAKETILREEFLKYFEK